MTDEDKTKIIKLKAEKKILRRQLKEVEEKKALRASKIESTAFMFAVIGNVLGALVGWSYDMAVFGLFGGAIAGWLIGTAIASIDIS